MTLEEQARLSFYREIAVLSEEHGISVVQHAQNKRIYVKKVLSTYEKSIFDYLKENHIPNTPYIYEAVEDCGRLIVIEEYISGRSLQEILDENGPFSEEAVVKIIYQLCYILRKMHRAAPGIIHRDIKPSNILMDESGNVTLLDMDAAKLVHLGSQDTQLIGTFGYAAPEQYGFGVSTVQTDIYSLGVLMNMLLVGKFPNVERHRGGLSGIIEGCLRIDPEKRFRSVDDILLLLEPMAAGMESVDDVALGKENLPPGFRTKDPVVIVLSVIGYLLLIAIGYLFVLPDVPPLEMWLYRVFLVLTMFSMVLFAGNYRGILDTLRITKVTPMSKQLGLIAVGDVVIGLVCFGVMYLVRMLIMELGA